MLYLSLCFISEKQIQDMPSIADDSVQHLLTQMHGIGGGTGGSGGAGGAGGGRVGVVMPSSVRVMPSILQSELGGKNRFQCSVANSVKTFVSSKYTHTQVREKVNYCIKCKLCMCMCLK